jgi:glycosyltransferase involved in cell wall biosynthesis
MTAPDAPPSTRLSVVIPVYNEEKTIVQVLDRVARLPFVWEVLVVDDGSKDGTRDRLRAYRPPDHPRFTIHFQPQNRGKGAAVRTGFSMARGDIVVVQDADLELNPDDLGPLYRLVSERTSDVAFGSRFLRRDARRWSLSLLANKILTSLTCFVINQRITDMETCYKMFRAEVLRRVHLRSDSFGFEPEVTIKVARLGYRIRETAVDYIPRREGKKINWKDGFAALWHILVFRFWDRP